MYKLFAAKYIRNLIEFLAIIVAGGWLYGSIKGQWLSVTTTKIVILMVSFSKTGWFIYESSKQLLAITRQNLPYHRFLWMLGINMAQIILSFAIDYFLLALADPASFNGLTTSTGSFYQLFDFFYYSCLNFSFFGFGDITPHHISAKVITLTEVLLAFATVIFVLSDFVTLKDSLRGNLKDDTPKR
jgi:Ion channel